MARNEGDYFYFPLFVSFTCTHVERVRIHEVMLSLSRLSLATARALMKRDSNSSFMLY